MRKDLGFRLSRQAKFWLDASSGDRFLWVWFVPIGDVVAVVEEAWKRGKKPSYKVRWWSIEELEELLSEVYAGAYSFRGYKINRADAVIENWTDEEKEQFKKWYEIRRRLMSGEQSEELLKAYNDGIRKGYYLRCI